MSDLGENKKKALKELIEKLHAGAKPEEIKERFKEVLKDVGPAEISQVEEELIKEGMPREKIHKLCELHLAVFKESLEKEKALAPPGHPIHILMEEHKILLEFAEELKENAKKMKGVKAPDSARDMMTPLNRIAEYLKESESHYLREENVLFPYLEKHGITQPPAMMWAEHDQIRKIKKDIYSILDARGSIASQDFVDQLQEATDFLAEMLSNHFYKENNILFPTALKVIEENEWKEIRAQFDELGYPSFTPESARMTIERGEAPIMKTEIEGMVPFETGSLSREEMESILNTLPVDVTFVDKNDTVRYFSQSKERIFVRTKAVLGRKVQQCHPQKSIHVVNQILEDFKNGKSDVAEFWINFEGKLIYIRYFPVRGRDGEYLGCLEVTQDITSIKKIEGEKRLL